MKPRRLHRDTIFSMSGISFGSAIESVSFEFWGTTIKFRVSLLRIADAFSPAMREFHAKCVKISRILGWRKFFFFDFRGFTQKVYLALAVLKYFENCVDGFCEIGQSNRLATNKQIIN